MTISRLLEPLWVLLATATDSQLKQTLEYLKAENRILRDKLPDRITLTPQERTRLVKLGSKLGLAIKEIVTIVSPRTFARWVDDATTPKAPSNGTADTLAAQRKPGRPKTPEEVREVILRLARENGWGHHPHSR